MLSNLKNEIKEMMNTENAIAGFNVFGIEDAIAIAKAAEESNTPTLFMLNDLALNYMPVEYWVDMLKPVAENAKVPISIHLDHCRIVENVIKAMEAGCTSVMYDGSQLPLDENIENMKIITEVAKKYDVSVEGEIGSVPYADIPGHAKDLGTTEEELIRFQTETDVDWIAVAVGQVHRLVGVKSVINYELFDKLNKVATKPLIIHGGTGIDIKDMKYMCSKKVGKINFGTSLRVAFVKGLHEAIDENREEFDKLKLYRKPIQREKEAAQDCIERVRN